ncbi:uncharacterized protein LOC122993436 [Scomber scombrus]|uniref:Uncharacterized protein LOC122993436 n=1 Tax=Scomber scombrus TaxID=13677 RepID=A0AAV1QD30_SCOSC
MDSDRKQTIQMAALGRPFSLGMLYDCRKDSLIPSMTLWDHDELLNHIGERSQCYNDFEIVTSESIEDKCSSLNVDASLKLSFFLGLFETNGSAKYLDDCKKSKHQARVTLKYEATTKFRELSMDHLGGGNIKYPDVFDKGIATHVVTAILYGAQAFFVFDREVSKDEDHQVVEGNLKFMVAWIPCIKAICSASMKLNDESTANVEKFSCKFHGDFFLDRNPVTYQDAVQVYQNLPKLLGANRENVVPMKVWLLPLTCLDSGVTQLVRQISAPFIRKVQTVIENLSELEMRCNDALKTTIVEQFPEIGKKLKTFKKLCFDFKDKFQKDFAEKLPLIRGGEEEEVLLDTFNMDKLMKWMDYAEKEIYTLQSFINMMKNIKIVPSENDLHKETLSAEHAVCLVFTPLGSAELYLTAVSNYLEETPKPDNPQEPHCHGVEKEQLDDPPDVSDAIRNKAKLSVFTPLGSAEPYLPALSNCQDETVKPVPPETEVLGAIRNKAKLFSDFAEANKENKNIKFLIVALPNKAQKGPSIYLYKDGFPVTEDFEPPSKPETVEERDITHNSVTLNIRPPRFGAKNITSYSVEYCVNGEDGWQNMMASTAQDVTDLRPETVPKAEEVSGLTPNTEYMFRCRAVTSAGVGPARNVHHSIKTLSCEEPQTEPPFKCDIPVKSKETITVHVCTKTCEFPQAAQSVLEDITELEMRCNNAMTTTIVQQFPQIGKKLKTFEELCSLFKLEFQLTLAKKLPSILEGGEEEVVLADILKKRHSSPFSSTNLNKWMDCKEKEICILKSFTKMLKNTKIVPSQSDLQEEILSSEHAVCFVFTSLGSDEPYLSALSNYLNQTLKPDDPEDPYSHHIEREQWYASLEVSDATMNKAKLFSDFAEANKDNKNVKFLTVGLTNETQQGSSIYVYKDILSVNENFEPPSKPETVTAGDVTHNSVTLKISPPIFGEENITCYSLEYCVSGEDEWQKTTTPKAEEVIVSGLTPNTEYMFRCRAVTSIGVGPAGVVSGPNKALPGSSPGKPQVETNTLKDKYKKDTNEKSSIQDLIKREEEEIVRLQDWIVSLMDQSAQCITHLQEIALKPNSLTTPEYSDKLIEVEKSEAKEGYQSQIQSLEAMKNRAKTISKEAK